MPKSNTGSWHPSWVSTGSIGEYVTVENSMKSEKYIEKSSRYCTKISACWLVFRVSKYQMHHVSSDILKPK